jgi:acyl carrier protein
VTLRPPDLADLARANDRARRRMLTRYLQDVLVQVADLSTPPPADVGLFDLGIESLHAVEVKGRLELAFGLELEDTLLLDEPSIEALVGLLNERLAPVAGWGAVESTAPPAPLAPLAPRGSRDAGS